MSWSLSGAETQVASAATVRAEGQRVAFAFGEDLEEWWTNDRRGFEHGYTVQRRPARDRGDDGATLTFTLAVRGELRPDVTGDGLGARFVDDTGITALT